MNLKSRQAAAASICTAATRCSPPPSRRPLPAPGPVPPPPATVGAIRAPSFVIAVDGVLYADIDMSAAAATGPPAPTPPAALAGLRRPFSPANLAGRPHHCGGDFFCFC
jgi:hypothetical protein